MENALGSLSLVDRKLVIGIDFGTTFTGVAWAETRRPDHISVVESWPSHAGSQEGMSSVKVPTELRYTGSKSAENVQWGFQIPSLVDRYQWFKLGLDETNPLVSNKSWGDKTPEKLTEDYLTQIYMHIMYTLEQKLGAALLRTIPLQFSLTVPAIWTEAAKDKTLKACQKAGLKSDEEISLVTEPEAAAIYALHGLDPHGLDIGDSFVLCDAGGGTVDLISYTITGLTPILQVKEITAGTGGPCGSTFLNRRFGDFLTRKLGREDGWDDEVLTEAMERFDSVIKKQYSPTLDGTQGYVIPVPGLANNAQLGVRRGKVTIAPEEMHTIFEPVILKVIRYVQDQIAACESEVSIKAVLLVGGFGQNSYLKERMREALKSVEVLQPPNAWTAVVRGAVMMGLSRTKGLSSVDVVSRKARKHYGIQLHAQFNPAKHDISQKYWCSRLGFFRAPEMVWFVTKGLAIEENKPIPIDFNQDYLVSDGKPQVLYMDIYADAELSKAPVHKANSTKVLVTLKANLSGIPQADLDKTIRRRPDGKDYYGIDGSIEATYSSAETTYVLFCQGKRYATVRAEYAY
ncbi:Hsp70 family protein [Aspergillus lucknowensis]|uniref:Actin-like ATPase domain-containing protein n=1 Tax=Aspergillus lucknowensis TaxID=176173 RepID=A0ABR4LYF7_9EURO